MPLLEYEQSLSCSVEGAFEYLTRPQNVVELASGESKVTLLSAPDALHHGAELEFEIDALGQSMVHRITAFEPPSRVVEEMVHGPLEEWVHEHLFEESNGGVLLIDRVTFETPRGMIGLLITEKRIRNSLERGFERRGRQLEELVRRGELR